MITKFIVTTLIVNLFVLFPPPQAFSKLYTWTDKNGRVMRTYYPPPADRVQTKKPAARQQSIRSPKVELYVTSWCPYCTQAKDFFRSKGISVTLYDIEKDAQAAARKKKLDNKSGVPFAIVNGIKIHGYSPKRYSAALQQ